MRVLQPTAGVFNWIFRANATTHPTPNSAVRRLDWVDCAKGLCIILVVMFHSTHAVEESIGREGYIDYLVAFAKPFRMPDFFMISGLFLARVIERNWRYYLDRKVIHFAYFYAIWVTIHFLVKAPGTWAQEGALQTFYLYLQTFIQPLGTLWFIYLLAIFFVIARLLRRVPPALVFAVAAALQVARIETGWIVIDQTAERFIYFYTGYLLAPRIFALAAAALARPRLASAGLVLWAILNGALVFAGYGDLGLVSLLLGFAGAAAVVTLSALLSRVSLANPIRYCGRNSIIIYLGFFVPAHAARLVLVHSGIVTNVDILALTVTTAGVAGPLILRYLLRNTFLSFLFVRPARCSILKPKAGDDNSEQPLATAAA
ncbi:acyltransferase family protein [Flaviaesturariibacter aridisoli]|uniref:Acyltransferase n=1 Tax=Flaviaesturariibacter aridisoli TaxID=2545761 RepID=A0A4R4E7J5_9BACT|nr:acyltransferase family protein [Flaviaesturariibacter aridisoli]TCZ73718.1 acyltransferase [Flaviaesturariibacter aridisoli]